MAEVVGKMPPQAGRGPKFPWDAWLDGQVWRLVSGVDFTQKPGSFRTTVSSAAMRRDMRITSRIVDGDLYIQARPR